MRFIFLKMLVRQ
ncbi:hypothetical protein BDFB_014877 [Asbolus verrucosus]|uniref:Uncharacterized protein n=1 Tax=Asbolus verrucosus TaxID=1661398 RepID=A0A482VFB3_ASBVE|nr:hypothetical protein BDFB_014877 [Asbolus verrucosus]